MKERSGTAHYIAPEISPILGTLDHVVGPEIEMWAFGVLLYEMCVPYKPS